MQGLELTDYRAAVARMYLADTGLAEFRAERDKLFASLTLFLSPSRLWTSQLAYTLFVLFAPPGLALSFDTSHVHVP